MSQILTIGMGPAGLSTVSMVLAHSMGLLDKMNPSIEVRSNEKPITRITIIDAKKDFTRIQKITLPNSDVKGIFQLASLEKYGIGFTIRDDESSIQSFNLENVPPLESLDPVALRTVKFLQLLSQHHSVISIKDIQEYHLDILQLLKQACPQIKVDILQETSIASYEFGSPVSIATTLDGRKIEFTDLVIADGARSSTLGAIASQVNMPNRQPLDVLKNNAYGYLYLDISKFDLEGQKKVLTIANRELAKSLHHLKGKWGHEEIPLIYLHLDEVSKALYVVGEIPLNILELQNVRDKKEASNKWFLDILNNLYSKDLSQAPILSDGVFTQSPSNLEERSFEIASGKCFVLGDAACPANLLIAHGVHKALHEGQVVAAALYGYVDATKEIGAVFVQSMKDTQIKLEELRKTESSEDDSYVTLTLKMRDSIADDLPPALGELQPQHTEDVAEQGKTLQEQFNSIAADLELLKASIWQGLDFSIPPKEESITSSGEQSPITNDFARG